MRYSTTAIVLAAMSIGEAVAGPTHVHRHKHEKKAAVVEDWTALDWADMGINWSSAYAAGQASKTSAAASASTDSSSAAAVVDNLADNKIAAYTTSASVAASTTAASSSKTSSAKSTATSSSSSSLLDDIEELFDELVGASNGRTSFGTVVAAAGGTTDNYYGNYGSPYGSNVIKADSSASYSYTVNFVNTQSKKITVNIWNKVGPDMQPLSGSALAPKNTTLTITIPSGGSQKVAFDEDSQVAWAQACSSTAASGAFDTTWGEAQFLKTGSGYDMSAIMNSAGNNYNMTITSEEAPACTSDPTQNYWLTATEPIGDSDGSCYISQSTATLTVVMAGTM
ncbi:putative allergen asp f 4 protein [Botrytis fragariae]|uniref:Putative allergen asp f 4 protein n=1 Tax=Botrytis fragariae TaxID=1964551 RepID=A0A8H6AR44_9HELO|nr:putative allergen asp f 4 protein [Botrytis fragariae]KAF5871835.1 putative allergen asp f 4 protein [Botrytis fragariae]